LTWAFRSPPDNGIWMIRGDTAHHRAESLLGKAARGWVVSTVVH
jgi:hypothetical protein